MLTRRTALTLIGTASLVPWPIRRALAQPAEQAIAFIKNTTDRLVAIVNAPGSPQQKRRQLRQVLDTVVNHDDIARFCLGRFWSIATPDQQKEYMALFYDMLAVQIAGHLGDYEGVRITIGQARTFEDTEIVITTVYRPNAPVMRVDWVVSTSTGAPQIVDLIADGTSMRVTQASDFIAYLSHHQYNVQDLIAAMRQRSADSG
jgi:phospholipid transport system substrate-binding protein